MFKHFRAAAAVALISTVIAGGVTFVGWLDTFELSSLSLRASLLSSHAKDSGQVKLILLDQASLDWASRENYVQWPWPRQAYVPLLQFCQRAGAKAVGFDVLYTEPSSYSVEDDQMFSTAISQVTNVAFALFLSEAKPTIEGQLHAEREPPSNVELTFDSPDALTKALALTERSTVTYPIPEVRFAADMMGNVSENPGPDGVFRELHYFHSHDGTWVPSLGLSLFMLAHGDSDEEGPGSFKIIADRLHYQGQSFPVGDGLEARLRFRAPLSFSRYSAAAVIQSELRLQAGEEPIIDPEELKDAYVLFGFSAPGLKDLRPTPLSPAAPGVVLHATFLDNLIQGDFLRPASTGLAGILGLLFAFLSAWSILTSDKVWKMWGLLTLIVPLPFLISLVTYEKGVELPFAFLQLNVFLAMTGAIVKSYATEGRQKRFIKQAFRYYLSPAVIEEMIAHPDRLRLGGERRELSIFFSDIAGFSAISEKMDPEPLTALLNDYLSLLAGIIQKHGGTVDKFIGDAIVAFWNAPLEQADHAVCALNAAVECQQALNEKEAEYIQTYGANLITRIGIHTGPVIVGNMGSRERFDYSMLGDAANLASRLEGVNKVFGTNIIVSESTWEKAGKATTGRCLGKVTVVGRSEPVGIYEAFQKSDSYSVEHLQTFSSSLQQLEDGELARACEGFESLQKDAAAEAYVKVCSEHLKTGTAWDGLWSLTSK